MQGALATDHIHTGGVIHADRRIFMMKSVLYILVCFIILCTLFGCQRDGITEDPVQPVSESGKDTSQTEEETPPLTEEPTGKDEQNNMVEGTLIVNGKQIDSQFTCVDSESLNVHFSLTAVLEAVGAKVQQNGAEFVITYGDNSTTINTEDPLWEFPIPPGATNCVREIIAGELVIDSISFEGFLKNFLCADIEVQYSTATVMINQN